MLTPPIMYKGQYEGTDRNGSDHYAADYFDVKDVVDYIEAAKQRELVLLAVIETMRNDLICFVGIDADVYPIDTSQALREHEAKVLEEAANYFDSLDSMPEFERIKQAYVISLRRMAEERRKK